MDKISEMARTIGLSPVADTINAELQSEDDCGSYARNKITYNVNGRKIPAFLLLPKGQAPFPAVLVCHQHHSQRNWGKSEVCGIVGDPLQALGSALAERGFVVLAPDAICFEERRIGVSGTTPNHEQDERNHFLALCHGIITGETLAKIAIEDAIGAISVLNGLDCVDKNKIGCLGHSYGGSTTCFAAAFDRRIGYALASGSVASYKNRMDNRTGIEFSSIIPNFLKEFELVDIVEAIAPRELCVVCADSDKYSRDAIEVCEAASHAFPEGNLCVRQFSGDHAITPERFDYIINKIVSYAV